MRKGIVLKLFLLTTVLCMLILATIFIGQTIFFKQYYADRKVNDIKANINSFERDYLNRVGNVEAMQKLEQDFSKKNNIWITTLDRYGNLKNANDFYVEVKLNDFSQNKLGKVTVTIPLYNLLKIDEIENEKLRSTPGTKVYLSGIEKDDIFIPASVSMADGNLNWTNKPLDKKMSETALEIKKGNIKDKGDLYTNFAGSIVKFQSPASIALGNPIYINDLFMERV
ncbi:two-component sensor histidine kinase, partial [Bacillus thuringiensis]